MIYENVELHNVAEAQVLRSVPGVMLRRFPQALRDVVNMPGRRVTGWCAGCEVRFVTESPAVRATFFCLDGDAEVSVYSGDFFHGVHKVPSGTMRMLQADYPSRFQNVRPEMLRRNFSPRCWRFVVNRGEMAFVSVDALGAEIRPPREDEKPRRRWLAYGSSITHSHCDHGYLAVAAKLLGVDVINLGLSGSCHLEPAMSDFIVGRQDWDFLTAELGINMRGHTPTEEFRRRATYFIDRLVESHPDKPTAIITHFPTHATHCTKPDDEVAIREREYDQTLRDLVAAKGHKRLHLIDGSSILERYDTLSHDLVHPTSVGQTLMGVNLARRLAEIIA